MARSVSVSFAASVKGTDTKSVSIKVPLTTSIPKDPFGKQEQQMTLILIATMVTVVIIVGDGGGDGESDDILQVVARVRI